MGVAATSKDDFGVALARLDQAAAWLDQLPEDRRGRARFVVEVRRAEMYFHAGDRERARQTLEQARREARAAPTPPNGQPVYGSYYRLLTLVLLWQLVGEDELFALIERDGEGEYLTADTTQQDVEKRDKKLYAPLQMLRCELLHRRGARVAAAQALLALGEELRSQPAKATPQWRDQVLHRVAWHYVEQQDWDRAEVYLTASEQPDPRLRVLIAKHRDDWPRVEQLGRELALQDARYAHMVGEALEQQGRPAAALVEYQRALAAFGASPDQAATHDGIGDCYLQLDDLTAARAAYEQGLGVLADRQSKFDQAERCELLKDLGRVSEMAGDAPAAFELYQRALQAIEAARVDIPLDPLGSGWLGQDSLVETVDGILRTAEDGWTMLAALERGKARGLLDWMAQPPAPDKLEQLQSAVQALSLADDPGQLDTRRQALERARVLAEEAKVRSASTLTAEQLREAAGSEAGVVWLSYWIGDERAVCIVAGYGIAPQPCDLGPRAQALAALRDAYEAVTNRERDPSVPLAAAADVFLPAAIRAHLRPGRRVVFCPDSMLSQLPFEALALAGQPVGTAFEVEWAPSLSVRQVLTARQASGDGVVVVCEVEAEGALEPLRFSAQEGDAVAAAYASLRRVPLGLRELRRGEATLAHLARALRERSAAVVHVNAHAIASPIVPSRSLLLLGDGSVSMASLAGLSLDGAVVVLSACSSAAGETRGGEGVAGLLWGPMAGGARAVIASLWRVNQEATCKLMGAMHAHRAAGLGEAAALRAARAELAGSTRFAHPYYWAGFVAYGTRASNPIVAGASSWLGWWLGIVALAPVGLWYARRRRGSAARERASQK